MAKKFVSVELDKSRNMRFGMVALIKMEEKLGKPISELDLNKIKMSELAVIIWAGLYHEDNTLTPDKVAELVDDYSDIQTISKVMSQCFEESFGKNEHPAVATIPLPEK